MRQTLRRRFGWLAVLLAVIWAVEVVNTLLGHRLNPAFGLLPRRIAGLDGIAAMPLLHASVSHAAANTLPLLALGGLLAATATRALWRVNLVIVVLGGALMWLFARTAIHVGASGLIFGWFGFLLARGALDRSLITVGVAALVAVLYGAMIWGVLPGTPGISWEAHLFGAAAGVAAAATIRTHVEDPAGSRRTPARR